MMQANPITCDVSLFVLLPVLCLEGVHLFFTKRPDRNQIVVGKQTLITNSFVAFTKVCKQNNVYIKHNVLYKYNLPTTVFHFLQILSKFPFFFAEFA